MQQKEKKKNQISIDLSLRVYPLDAVFGACYRLIDRFFVYLDQPEKGKLSVTITPKNPDEHSNLREIAGGFSNDLLHQVLRLRIGKKTGAVRDMIVGRALLSADPSAEYAQPFVDKESEMVKDLDSQAYDDKNTNKQDVFGHDYLDDPLGIAVPWEEKFADTETKVDPEQESFLSEKGKFTHE